MKKRNNTGLVGIEEIELNFYISECVFSINNNNKKVTINYRAGWWVTVSLRAVQYIQGIQYNTRFYITVTIWFF